MSLQSLAQVVSLTALFNLACNQHDRPLGRKVTGQFDCQVASSCGYEWFVALRYGTLGARTGGASLDFEGEGIGGAWHSADQGTSLEMSWNVLDVLKCLEMSWNVLKCLEMSWIFMYILTWNLNPTFQKFRNSIEFFIGQLTGGRIFCGWSFDPENPERPPFRPWGADRAWPKRVAAGSIERIWTDWRLRFWVGSEGWL